MALLHVSELPPQRAEQAYGLVRLASTWSRSDWLGWLADRDEHRGALCVTALGGVLLGIAAYRVTPDRQLGRVLRITLFLAFELGRKGATSGALRERLELLAEQLGCGAILYDQESRGLLEPSLS